MARNIEIKARLPSLTRTLQAIAAIAPGVPEDLWQEDTFFNCNNGRLKLRQAGRDKDAGELIFYVRDNHTGPKESRYSICDVRNAVQLCELLAVALGVVGRVCKRRRVFTVGNTRIHVDEVAGLGNFLELEVVLGKTQPRDSGRATAISLMERLGIDPSDLVADAYVDLLAPGRRDRSR